MANGPIDRHDVCLGTELWRAIRGFAVIGIGDGLYVQIPDESEQRLLYPAKIVGVRGNVYTAEVEEEDLALEDGKQIIIYYENRREFVQQVARIDTVIRTELKAVLGFETTSKPVSAERRQCYRISTVISNLTAKLDSEDACPLLNISATGFSVIAAGGYRLGSVVQATLRYDDQEYTGDVCIVSMRELNKGRIRYGLYGLDDKKHGGNIQKGLQHMSTAVQRQQLRRLVGST
jgi:hypothetical protein